MEKEEFLKKLYEKAKMIGVEIDESELEKFYQYMNVLLDWNTKINLTAITDPEEIILKHFIDSITINRHILEGQKVIDIGTGAGFPGIPLKILNNKTNFTLVDSLNKRILFLDTVKDEIHLENISCIHARVEDLSQDKEYREVFDIITSRAVARLNILVEYMLPFIKIGGKCICMKGPEIEEEVKEAEKAIKLLGGNIIDIEKIVLPNSDIERNIILIEKKSQTPLQYPRRAGIPSKNPII